MSNPEYDPWQRVEDAERWMAVWGAAGLFYRRVRRKLEKQYPDPHDRSSAKAHLERREDACSARVTIAWARRMGAQSIAGGREPARTGLYIRDHGTKAEMRYEVCCALEGETQFESHDDANEAMSAYGAILRGELPNDRELCGICGWVYDDDTECKCNEFNLR